MDDLFPNDEFQIWQPGVTLAKGAGDSDRRIGGYASTEALDRQGEVVLQQGLDFSEFVQHGYFNDNHNQNTAAVVGIPEMANYEHGKGWYVEGSLLKGTKRAEEIWELAKALSDTPRKLGFSIEGKVQRRDSNKIVKAIVRHVAITNSPVNTECTWGVLAKSFCSNPGNPECTGSCCSAGKANKAFATGTGLASHGAGPATSNGGALRVAHLDGQGEKKKKTRKSLRCNECQKSFASERGLDGHLITAHPTAKNTSPTEVRRLLKSLSREEAIIRVRTLRPHLSESTAARVVDYVLAAH